MAVVNGRRSSERTYVTGAISITSGGEAATLATAILIAPALSLTHDLQVAVELIAHAAIGIVNTCVANNSRDFWRTRGIDFAGQIARLKSAQASDGMERALIERAVTAISKLRARTRMNGLGDLLAKLGPFDAWIIATIEEGELKLAGCSATLSSAPANELRNMRASTLAECFQRQSAIVRMGGAPITATPKTRSSELRGLRLRSVCQRRDRTRHAGTDRRPRGRPRRSGRGSRESLDREMAARSRE